MIVCVREREWFYICESICVCVCVLSWEQVLCVCQLSSGDTLEGYYSLLPSPGTMMPCWFCVWVCERQRTASRRLSVSCSVCVSLLQVSVFFLLFSSHSSSRSLFQLSHALYIQCALLCCLCCFINYYSFYYSISIFFMNSENIVWINVNI